jgi:hypothetical protein
LNAQQRDTTHMTDEVVTPIYDITPEESREIFDENARYYMGMSGAEFRRPWEAREFGDVDSHADHVKIMDVTILLPAVEGYEPGL